MSRERLYKFLLILVSTFTIHLFVFFDFRFLLETTTLPKIWHTQSYYLIVASFLVSILMIAFSKIRPFLLIIKFIVLMLLGYPLGKNLNIETILLISIIIEAVYYFPERYGGVLSFLMIVIVFRNQKVSTSWGDVLGRADNHQLLFFLFMSLLVLFLSMALRKVFKVSEERALDVARMDYAVGELTEINLGYQNHAVSVKNDSIENERKRISREMHDIIGYTLTNQLMIIQAVLSMKQDLPPKIESLLLQSQQQTKDGMSQARSALYKLREFSPGEEVGLKLIINLVKTFEQVTGIDIKIEYSNCPDTMGRKIDKVLYRFIQEGLTNAFRHGRATKMSIILSLKDDYLQVSVWDNGIGSNKIVEGIGFKGMRERLESVNGWLEVLSEQSGFSIKARIPYVLDGKENVDESTFS